MLVFLAYGTAHFDYKHYVVMFHCRVYENIFFAISIHPREVTLLVAIVRSCRVPVAQSVTTRAVNPGVVSSNTGSANFLSDV